jgi:chromosomal replication initiation ATPase DnaA
MASSPPRDDIAWGISRSRARLALWCASRDLGIAYNPLFVYGDNMTDIQEIRGTFIKHIENIDGLSVGNLSVTEYCTEYLEAFKKDEGQLFFDDVLTADVLVVDRLELLGKFSKVQQSNFLRMLELMCGVNKQVVLFSALSVRKIRGLVSPNLLSRFDRALELEM